MCIQPVTDVVPLVRDPLATRYVLVSNAVLGLYGRQHMINSFAVKFDDEDRQTDEHLLVMVMMTDEHFW